LSRHYAFFTLTPNLSYLTEINPVLGKNLEHQAITFAYLIYLPVSRLAYLRRAMSTPSSYCTVIFIPVNKMDSLCVNHSQKNIFSVN